MNINGRMKVKTLRSDFMKEFGLTIRVYDGRSFADEDATLASIRKGDSKGGEFSPKRNSKVGLLENKIEELFGLKTQIAGSDDSYLCDNDLTLKAALEEDERKLSGPRRKNYSDDFKREVAEAASQPGSTLSSIGEQFDVNPTLVRNWKIQFSETEKLRDTNEPLDYSSSEESNLNNTNKINNMYKLRKCEKYTVIRQTEVANLDPEKFRDLSVPFDGETEEDFLNYISELDYEDISEELDEETDIELNKFYDAADWSETYNSSWDSEESWLDIGEPNESNSKSGGFDVRHTTK
jgi:transposase-like protein